METSLKPQTFYGREMHVSERRIMLPCWPWLCYPAQTLLTHGRFYNTWIGILHICLPHHGRIPLLRRCMHQPKVACHVIDCAVGQQTATVPSGSIPTSWLCQHFVVLNGLNIVFFSTGLHTIHHNVKVEWCFSKFLQMNYKWKAEMSWVNKSSTPLFHGLILCAINCV